MRLRTGDDDAADSHDDDFGVTSAPNANNIGCKAIGPRDAWGLPSTGSSSNSILRLVAIGRLTRVCASLWVPGPAELPRCHSQN